MQSNGTAQRHMARSGHQLRQPVRQWCAGRLCGSRGDSHLIAYIHCLLLIKESTLNRGIGNRNRNSFEY